MDTGYRTVEVLMSTYNGEINVGRQLESVLSQTGVQVHVTIRDDGSTDGTVALLRAYEEKYPSRITVHEGLNVGYKHSFLNLLDLAESADFYAFSDQDDVWEHNKLDAAISMIGSRSRVLYVSNLDIYNPHMEKLSSTTLSQKSSSIYSEFTRHRYAGCTYVFDRKLKESVSIFSHLDIPDESMPSHDSLIARCAYSCGEVVVDENAYIRHIRYPSSVTAGGNGLMKRLKLEWKILVTPSVASRTASLILEKLPDIHVEARMFLEKVASYRKSWKKWLQLLSDNRLKTGVWQCDILCRLKILIRTY